MLNFGIFAQTAPNPTDAGQFVGYGVGNIVLIVGFIILLYFIMFLPERKKMKNLQKQISALKIGDKIVTGSGIYGIVDFISEKTVYVKSLDSKLEIDKSSIAAVLKNQSSK
jgi:preprotein translocase subunit YajC